MFCTQNNVFEMLRSFGLEIFRFKTRHGKYQAKTDSSPSEDAESLLFFIFGIVFFVGCDIIKMYIFLRYIGGVINEN